MHTVSNIKKLFKLTIRPIKKTEMVDISRAKERFLAENVYSSIDIPPANNSAVDGYLFNFDKLKNSNSKKFTIDREIHAGEDIKGKYTVNDTFKISTGAHIPKGFNAVVMEEDFLINGKIIILNKKKIFKWMNIRKKGEDIKKNQKVFSSGHFLRPQDIGMLSSLGIKKIKVFIKIKVGILSNGDELVEPGKTKRAYQIYDSNRYILSSFLNNNYTELVNGGIINDNYEKIKRKIISLKKKCDLIILSGGASLGNRDYVIKIIKEIGIIKFWRVSIKPGRPFGFGLLKNNLPVLILPGNPVACFVIFFIFGIKLLHYINGNLKYEPKYYLVKSNFNMKKKVGREEFLRGKSFTKNGMLYVNKFHKQGAGILKSLVWSDGLIRLKSSKKLIKKDSFLEFYPFQS